MMHKILIVEDEPEIATLIRNRLGPERYRVTVVHDGDEALRRLEREQYDLVTLDVMLPGRDGVALCRDLRSRCKETLIVMVTALGSEEQVQEGYVQGADDYLCKPFSPKMLAVKIDTLLRRRDELRRAPVRRFGMLEHHEAIRAFRVDAKPLVLTPSEYAVLEALFRAPHAVLSRDDLAQVIFDGDLGQIDRRGIDTHVYRIRSKIAALCGEPVIRTVRHFGYTLHED
jgi:two-component system response regulator ArlR